MTKIPNRLEIKKMCLNIIKAIYSRAIANIMLSGENLKAFLLLRSGR
jgi:glutaredoxin-related protein